MIDISIIALVATGILSAYSASFKAMDLAKSKTSAVALSNEKIEEMRNMPYDSLATEHGTIYPPGTLKDSEEIDRNGVKFNVRTAISYVDDPFDGNAEGNISGKPKDLYPYDYKKIEVVVLRVGRKGYLAKLTSNVAAKAAETPSNTGIIRLCVVDSLSLPVADALVTILNPNMDPPVNISATSGNDGCVMVPNLPPDEHNNYHLTATKDGYSIDMTYPRTSQNPNEKYQDVNVLVQQVTNKTLVIDKLSSMEIDVVSGDGTPYANKIIHLENSKEIYFNPTTYKYSKDLTTDQNGHLKVQDLEFGDYKFSIPGQIISSISPYQPVDLEAGVTLPVKVYLANSNSAPIIMSCNPAIGKVGEIAYLTIKGNNFDKLLSIKLVNNIGAEVLGSNVVVSGRDTIEAEFNMVGAQVGNWDIVITNMLGESVRQISGFELKNE